MMKNKTYLSNNGRGPGVAEFVREENGVVTIRHKPHAKANRWTQVSLSAKFFYSDKCGWKAAVVTRRKKAKDGE